jgi:hypothetical protein
MKAVYGNIYVFTQPPTKSQMLEVHKSIFEEIAEITKRESLDLTKFMVNIWTKELPYNVNPFVYDRIILQNSIQVLWTLSRKENENE